MVIHDWIQGGNFKLWMYDKAQRAVWDLAHQTAMANVTAQANRGRCDTREMIQVQ